MEQINNVHCCYLIRGVITIIIKLLGDVILRYSFLIHLFYDCRSERTEEMCSRSLSVPHISVTVHENDLQGGALKILKVLRPTWNAGNVQFKVGFLNYRIFFFFKYV